MGTWTARADAQVGLTQAVVETIQLSEEQRSEISRFVETYKADLSSDKPVQVAAARKRLMEPLGNMKASVSFRTEMSRGLMDVLPGLAQGQSRMNAINAVILAADLATEASVDVVEGALKSSSNDLRCQAAAGSARLFDIASEGTPALQPARLSRLIDALEAAAAAEKDPIVSKELFKALASATRVANTRFPEVRARGITAGARAAGTALRGYGDKPAGDMQLDGVLAVLGALRDAAATAQQQRIPDAALKESAALAAETLAYAVRLVEAREQPLRNTEKLRIGLTLREMMSQLAAPAEAIIVFSGRSLLPPAQIAELQLAETLRKGEPLADAKFTADVRTLAGPGGALSKDPFGFEPERFLKRR